MSDLSHLRLLNTGRSVPYTFVGGFGGPFRTPPRDRVPHARKLKGDLATAEADAEQQRQQQPHQFPCVGEVLTIRSRQGFKLKLDSLERMQSGIELVSVKVDHGVTVANVFVPTGKYVYLLGKIDAYEQKEWPNTGLPKNRELIESIESIRLAAVRDFWRDNLQFPPADDAIWWEVWLRRGGERPEEVHRHFAHLGQVAQLRVREQYVAFPERVVVLAYGTQRQLATSIDLLALIAELRRAKELATDYVELLPREQRQLIDDAVRRLRGPDTDAPVVCILDSGVNRGHPLLTPALAAADAQTINPAWGTADDRHQHGTQMAGIALYGCLTGVLQANQPVTLRHRLESVKILPPEPLANDPENYGWVTIQGVARAEIQAPTRNRVLCMAVSADDRDLGMPSLWSAAVDQICSGADDDTRRLMFVAAGNMRDEIGLPEYEYHNWNCRVGGVEDPAQSWNAVTVGAYTEKVMIRQQDFRGWQPLAPLGDLCPTSRTSLPWPPENQIGWPLKPDIVVEGGNYAELNGTQSACDDLSLLTTYVGVGGALLTTTRDTSPATAAAARMAATIWSYYPALRPETVRALMIHSARWTDAMIEKFPGYSKANVQERLRCYGYGVPQLQRAIWSAENAATLVFEGELQPYHKVGSDVRSNEMHVHTLPWPVQVLEELGETPVTMRVTLSYFIEPSPGRIGWTRKHRYQSHGLRFDVNRPVENEDAFRQRLSRAEWDDPDDRPVNVEETRNWEIGDQGRRRGSVHSDWWTGTAAELASCNRIAVHPVTGWWRERSHLQRWNRVARYSLIITLETPDVDVDLYTPISLENVIETEMEI